MSSTFEILISKLSVRHQRSLKWFIENKGKKINGWPEPLSKDELLLTMAKGIYKPKDLDHALSVRMSLNGPYDDQLIELDAGKFTLKYYQENLTAHKRDLEYTNIAMNKCINDVVPVGVFIQRKSKPNPIYEVMGPAIIKKWEKGFYALNGFDFEGEI